ncbi:hypothetical protein AA0472_2604 [Acetobacter estunensis NRIC 0472]|nr:hypothetical protein AA0472_2604 [Acetobacter estunensis NRIC 0472]
MVKIERLKAAGMIVLGVQMALVHAPEHAIPAANPRGVFLDKGERPCLERRVGTAFGGKILLIVPRRHPYRLMSQAVERVPQHVSQHPIESTRLRRHHDSMRPAHPGCRVSAQSEDGKRNCERGCESNREAKPAPSTSSVAARLRRV